MVSTSFLLQGLLLPAAIAGLALVLFGRSRRAGAIGFGLGFLVGHWGSTRGLPHLPPRDATEAIPYAVLAATVVGLFEGGGASSLPARLAPRVLVSVLAPLLVFKNLLRGWEGSEAFEQIGLLALLVLVVWFSLDALAERRPGASVPLALWVAASGAAASLALSGSALHAQLAGTLAAVCGAAAVASCLRRDLSLARGGAGVYAMALGALCAGGVYLSSLPRISAELLFLSPLALAAGEHRWVESRKPWQAALARALLVAIPVGAALYLAWQDRPPPNPYAG